MVNLLLLKSTPESIVAFIRDQHRTIQMLISLELLITITANCDRKVMALNQF